MVEDTQDDTLAALRGDDLDCAFIAHDPDALGEEFSASLLWTDELVVALPPGHTLTAEDGITFEQLACEDLIAFRENSAIRRRLERKMADRALEPRNAFICTEMAAVRALASRGLGVAVMPRSVAEEAGPPIELRPLAPERLTWPVALVWRAARRQSPAGKAFLKVALEHARQPSRPQPARGLSYVATVRALLWRSRPQLTIRSGWMRISGVGIAIASARPRTSIPRGCQGSVLARSSTTIAARPVRATSRNFFVSSSSWPPTSIVSRTAL